MKTHSKKFITVITLGALALSAISGSVSALLHHDAPIQVDAKGKGPNNDSVEVYYEDVNPNSTTLLKDLQTLNANYRGDTPGYDGLKSIYKKTDADPDGSGQILGFYDNHLVGPNWDSAKTWNREHVWPDSIGGGSVQGDAYMPRPTWVKANSSRGNAYYAESGAFDPGYEYEDYRGISARIIFYCMVANSNLKLVDIADKNPSTKNTMGKISDLLKWNLEYLPSSSSTASKELRCEYNRNNVIQKEVQGNRNPFVDHPEYACKIWGNFNDATKAVCKSTPTPTKTLSSITVSGNGKTNYVVGETFNKTGFTVTATYSDSTTANVTSSASFENITFITEGVQTVTVSYTEGTTTKTTTVSVNVTASAVPVTSVSLDKSTLTLDEGDSDSLVATVLPSNATNKNVTWTSSDEEVVEVVNGVVTGISQGTATITVSTVDGSKTASCNVTVNHTEDIVHVTSVSLNKKNLTLNVDEEFTLEATVLPENATIKGVKWASTNEEVAIVEDGKVTALKAGACTISATSLDKKKIAVCTITVNEDVPDPTPDPDPTPSSNEQIIKILKVSAIVLGVTTVVVIFGIVIPVSVHKKHKRKMK